MKQHPLHQFAYCPVCGQPTFVERNEKAKMCTHCGFVYYFNPSAAVACFIRNAAGELLLVRRAKEPGKGTLDLPGGFVDMYESGEEAAAREVREETGLEIHQCRPCPTSTCTPASRCTRSTSSSSATWRISARRRRQTTRRTSSSGAPRRSCPTSSASSLSARR